MKVFVTGATGFLGRRLVARLIREGHTVSALARSEQGAAQVQALGAQPVLGDFDRITAWETALQGVDVVVHCAAPVETWGPWQLFATGIVDATRELLAAAGRKGVRRFVYISSESVLQDREPLLDIDESKAYPAEPNSFYGRAKKLAEQEILSADTKVERIILRPTFIWGPGVKALETMVAKIHSGEFMWIDQGSSPFEMVHVDNVVEAIVRSLRAGRDGGIYFVTDGQPMTVRDFLSALIGTTGTALPRKNMNGAVARFAAGLVESVWRLLGIRKHPPLSRFELAFVSQPRRYRIDRIRAELGYQPVVNLELGLAEMRAGTVPS